jgi:transposase
MCKVNFAAYVKRISSRSAAESVWPSRSNASYSVLSCKKGLDINFSENIIIFTQHGQARPSQARCPAPPRHPQPSPGRGHFCAVSRRRLLRSQGSPPGQYEMLRRMETENTPVSQAAREFGLSRPSFYQAQAAFQHGGLGGLIPQKRGPRQAHKLTPEVIQFLGRIHGADPSLSWPELARRIRERFGIQVHPRSVERAWTRQQKKRP